MVQHNQKKLDVIKATCRVPSKNKETEKDTINIPKVEQQKAEAEAGN